MIRKTLFRRSKWWISPNSHQQTIWLGVCKSHIFSEVMISSSSWTKLSFLLLGQSMSTMFSLQTLLSWPDSDRTIFYSAVSWVLLRLRFKHLSLHPGQLLRLRTLYLLHMANQHGGEEVWRFLWGETVSWNWTWREMKILVEEGSRQR